MVGRLLEHSECSKGMVGRLLEHSDRRMRWRIAGRTIVEREPFEALPIRLGRPAIGVEGRVIKTPSAGLVHRSTKRAVVGSAVTRDRLESEEHALPQLPRGGSRGNGRAVVRHGAGRSPASFGRVRHSGVCVRDQGSGPSIDELRMTEEARAGT
jgi:hypothetical protein